MEPQSRIGLARLTKMAFQGVDLFPLHTALLTRCLKGEQTEGALMDLSVIEELQGNRDMGLQWQARALARQRAFITENSAGAKRKLLVFAQPGHMGANTPIEFLLQGAEFEIITYYLNDLNGQRPHLPDHDVAFCAAPADADRAEAFFDTVRDLTKAAGTEVLNLPQVQARLERDHLDKVVSYVPGLRVPRTLRVSLDRIVRALLNEDEEQMINALGGYPIVIRPCGSHAGHGLAKLATREALITYLAEHPEPAFFLSEFIPYASPEDGQFRKYRVVFVDGTPFPCHMAIAGQWDIWYLNAGMEQSTAKRADEAQFMHQFAAGFATRHKTALAALRDGIGLDYFGIDCAEDAEGNLVVFEADNALIVHDMDSEAIFPYKRPHMERIFTAFEEMLVRKCRRDTGDGARPWQRPQGHPVQVHA